MPIIKKQRAIVDADIPAAIARDAEFQSADMGHAASTNPHPNANYLTQAEADARYLNTGGGGSGIAATIATSAIENALRKRFKSNFFIESHYLATAGNGNFPAGFANGGFGYIRAETDKPGILGLSTGSSTNGFCSSSTGMGNNSSGIILDDGPITYIGVIKIPVLRDAVNDFVIEAGFQSSGSSIGFDACCFVCDSLSSNWQCHTRSNGDLAVFISTTPVVANQWYEMKISVSNGSATFSINNIDVLTTAQKLPLSPRMVGAGIDIRKIAGTSGRDTLIDYQSVEQTFNDNDENIIVQSRLLTDADIPPGICRDTEADSKISAAIATHAIATDPHPQYLLQSEGDTRYRQTAIPLTDTDIPAAIARDTEMTAAINTHVNATDPHPIYLTQSEGDERYPQFKRSLYTFSTGWQQGEQTYTVHNLDAERIVAISAFIVTDSSAISESFLRILPGGMAGFSGRHYSIAVDLTTIICLLHPTSSWQILGCPVFACIDWI